MAKKRQGGHDEYKGHHGSRRRRMIARRLFDRPALLPDCRQRVADAVGKLPIIVRRGIAPVLVVSAAAFGHGFAQGGKLPGKGRDLLFEIEIGEGRKRYHNCFSFFQEKAKRMAAEPVPILLASGNGLEV